MRLIASDLKFGWQEGAALGRLSFTLNTGKLLAVCGGNGSGKTSLLLTLAGVLRPLDGKVAVLGLEDLRKGSFYLGPELNFSQGLTAVENGRFILGSRGLNCEGFTLSLSKYGVPPNKTVREMSTGQVQRLRLACAAAAKQPLLLMDEPSLSLDAAGRAALRELLLHYKGLKVLATNDPGEVSLADEILALA